VPTGTILVSVEEYLASTHKPAYEYLEGVLREKPIATYDHSSVELQLCDLINGLDNGFRAVPELTLASAVPDSWFLTSEYNESANYSVLTP
jgi:hypothetical protein